MIQTQPASIKLATVVTLGRLGFVGPREAESARLLSQPKRVALLLYVLMSQRGGSMSRDQIIGTFWPESDTTRARNALRQSLSFLRSCLGDEAVRSIGSHGVAVAGSVECDAVHFETLLDAQRREEALGLYGGELLPGFYGGGSAFTEWLDRRRQHLSQRAAKAAWDLSAEHEAGGDLPGAAFWGKRALSLSPFSESEVQRLLRLLERARDFAGALRAFHGLQHALVSEFGSQPSAETTRLAAGIKRQMEAEGLHVPALLGTRRLSADRRVASRRKEGEATWGGVERRSGSDRRTTERRSGRDRREMR